jgi:hypothetical protein
MDSKNKLTKSKTATANSTRPVIKRRNFFLLFGAAAIGAIAMVSSPMKLLASKVAKSDEANSGSKSESKTERKNSITVKENPYAVKRVPGGRR